jgi:nitrate/TMAO reductase-like tetraheme cytochrome c subunit
MKKIKLIIITCIFCEFFAMYLYGCKPSQAIADKSGTTLWSENCQRCHNLPPATMYNDDQWKSIVTHMQIRANITKEEATKIVEFLQASN